MTQILVPVFTNFNEDGQEYDKHDNLEEAMVLLWEFPNGSIMVTLEERNDEEGDVCTWCGKPINLEDTGLWEDPELEDADKRRYCDLSPNYLHAT